MQEKRVAFHSKAAVRISRMKSFTKKSNKQVKTGFFLFFTLAAVASCRSKHPETVYSTSLLSDEEKGDSIATIAQNILLVHVAKAIQHHGTAGAVDFCNERAIPLTDSVSQTTASHIQRLSNRNRNPLNAIRTPQDSMAWKQLNDSQHPKKELIINQNGTSFYYKPIKLGMPVCLECHGSKEKDISPETLHAILEKYPLDKATGYKQGELRGMWKIKLN